MFLFCFYFRFGINNLIVSHNHKLFVSFTNLVYAWRIFLARTPVMASGAHACGVLGVIIKTSLVWLTPFPPNQFLYF